MRCAGHVACVGRGEMNIGVCGKDVMERNHFEGVAVNNMIILKWMFKKRNVVEWSGLLWFRIGQLASTS